MALSNRIDSVGKLVWLETIWRTISPEMQSGR